MRAFAPALARNGGGAVVDVHSVLSWVARPGAYAASKTAFWGLTNALRLELAEQKTQVLGAHLGYADTPLIAHLTDVAKSDPAVIVARVLDALEAGEDEAIADDVSAQVKSILPGITTGVLPHVISRGRAPRRGGGACPGHEPTVASGPAPPTKRRGLPLASGGA